MPKITLVPKHNEKVNTKLLKTPIADAFRKIESLPVPTLEVDLLRKRQKVKTPE